MCVGRLVCVRTKIPTHTQYLKRRRTTVQITTPAPRDPHTHTINHMNDDGRRLVRTHKKARTVLEPTGNPPKGQQRDGWAHESSRLRMLPSPCKSPSTLASETRLSVRRILPYVAGSDRYRHRRFPQVRLSRFSELPLRPHDDSIFS